MSQNQSTVLHSYTKLCPSLGAARSAHTNILVLEDLGVASVGVLPSELPHIKEGLPVDVGR